jgi:hypothetical protein
LIGFHTLNRMRKTCGCRCRQRGRFTTLRPHSFCIVPCTEPQMCSQRPLHVSDRPERHARPVSLEIWQQRRPACCRSTSIDLSAHAATAGAGAPTLCVYQRHREGATTSYVSIRTIRKDGLRRNPTKLTNESVLNGSICRCYVRSSLSERPNPSPVFGMGAFALVNRVVLCARVVGLGRKTLNRSL